MTVLLADIGFGEGLLFLPFLGVLLYLIVRGDGMFDRAKSKLLT